MSLFDWRTFRTESLESKDWIFFFLGEIAYVGGLHRRLLSILGEGDPLHLLSFCEGDRLLRTCFAKSQNVSVFRVFSIGFEEFSS